LTEAHPRRPIAPTTMEAEHAVRWQIQVWPEARARRPALPPGASGARIEDLPLGFEREGERMRGSNTSGPPPYP